MYLVIYIVTYNINKTFGTCSSAKCECTIKFYKTVFLLFFDRSKHFVVSLFDTKKVSLLLPSSLGGQILFIFLGYYLLPFSFNILDEMLN